MTKNQPKEISVAVIGAGISGLNCATRLKGMGFDVQVFEKSRGVSGRMSTRNADTWSADHGAQYFTARDPLFVQELNRWIKADVAAVWNPRLKVFKDDQWEDHIPTENRYVGIPAMNSPGKYLGKYLSIHVNQTIDRITNEQGQWLLHSQETGDIKENFDWLVLALPAPQAFALTKSIDQSIEAIADTANMQGCWTVMASFTKQTNIPFDAAFINDEIISWVAKNNSKPIRQGLETWTIHANPKWSQQWIELDKEEAAQRILDCAKRLGLDCSNAVIAVHRWRYASGHIDPIPGFHIREDLKLGICGDWLNGGRVEGAWLSGYHLAAEIQNSSQ